MGTFSRIAIGLIGVVTTACGVVLIYRHYNDIQKLKKFKVLHTKREVSPVDSISSNLVTRSCQNDKSDSSISPKEIRHLVSMLPSANTTKFFKIMKTLIQISNNNVNIPSFSSHDILDNLYSQLTLGGDGEFLRSVNVHVLNLFTNLVVDEAIRGYLTVKIDRFFDAKLSTLNMNEMVALFRLLGNFSMLSDSAYVVAEHFSEIFEFIVCELAPIRRQAWTVLLNLSCELDCIIIMLESSGSNDVDEILRNPFREKDEMILSKSLKFLCNVYRNLRPLDNGKFSRESLFAHLLKTKDDLKQQTTLYLSQVTSTEEIYEDVQRLSEILEESH
nr:cyclin dependent kinase 7 [Hymenolepis microstoma]